MPRSSKSSSGGNRNQEEGLLESTKEINGYFLRFNDRMMEDEYFQFSIHKYRQLGYVICVMQIIIFITDFIHLFQENKLPQKNLIFLVLMLIIAIFLLITLYFKDSWFNTVYSFYYTVYITLLGWSMYDFDSESSNPTTDDTTKVDVFTYGYAISTILTLGITGSNYLIKNLLFTYGTILLYVAKAIETEVQYYAIIRVIIVIFLYYYISYHREKAHRLSFLKQKQIDSYNNIMNNQIPHCLFAAKFNFKEQRIELFKCNSRAQKEFNINGNEDFDKFISNSYLVQSTEKAERSQVSVHATANSTKQNEQTWENSLKGKIRQLIQQKEKMEQKYLQQTRDDTEAYLQNNFNSQQNQSNNNSPIIKLKLRQSEGIGTENKINVRLSIFKLHEYYVIITVDRNRKKKNKIKKEVKSKSGRNSAIGTKLTKQLTLENIRIPNTNTSATLINNEITIQQQGELQSPPNQRYTINTLNGQFINFSQEPQQQQNQQQSQAISPNFQQQQQYSNSMFPASLKQSPSLLAQQHKDDDYGFAQKLSPPYNSVPYSLSVQHTVRQSTHANNHSFNIGNNTPTGYNGSNTPTMHQNIDSTNMLNVNGDKTQQMNNVNGQRKSVFNGRSVSSSNYLHYMTQKKLSLSTMGIRKPMNSINSVTSTCLPPSSSHINQPRNISVATEQYQLNPRISQGSRSNTNNNFNSNPGGSYNTQNYQAPHVFNQNQHHQEGKVKEQMFDTCFEIIAQTLALIQRFKQTAPVFKNSKVSTYFLPSYSNLSTTQLHLQASSNITSVNLNKEGTSYNHQQESLYYEAFEKYTSCIMQQILINNSNFMKFTRLVFNQINIKNSQINGMELIVFLKEQLQPVLVEKSIQLYLQDDFDQLIYTDSNILRLILMNLILYSGSILAELQYIAVKFSLIDDNSALKVQLSMPYRENHVFNHIDTLHNISLDQIQRDYLILHKFYIDLRVAFSMIKKLNHDNPNVSDYLKFSHSHPANNHMYLSFTIPLQNYSPHSQIDFPLMHTHENANNLTNTATLIRKSDENLNLADRDNAHFRSQNDINNIQYQNMQSREIKNTEECFLDDSISSLERWVTIKQYTTRITDKQIKLIL